MPNRSELFVTQSTFKRFAEQIDERFKQVDKRFEQVDERFDRIETKLTNVDHKLDKLIARIDKLDERAAKTNSFVKRVTSAQEVQTSFYIKKWFSKEFKTIRVSDLAFHEWHKVASKKASDVVTEFDGLFAITVPTVVLDAKSVGPTESAMVIVEAKNQITARKVFEKLLQIKTIYDDIVKKPVSKSSTKSKEMYHFTGVVLCFAAAEVHDLVKNIILDIHRGTFLHPYEGQERFRKAVEGNIGKRSGFTYESLKPILEIIRNKIFLFIGPPEKARLEPEPLPQRLFETDLIPGAKARNTFGFISTHIPSQVKHFPLAK